ncbi:MAG: hypothetical protein RR357_05865 [Clostridia bacterium]
MKQTRNIPQRNLARDIVKNNREHTTADKVYELERTRKSNY